MTPDIETVTNLSRFYIAKKAPKYGLVLRAAEPKEVSAYFQIPDSGIPGLDKLAVAYVDSLERNMDDLSLQGLERTAFLGAEALSMHLAQGLSWSFASVGSSTPKDGVELLRGRGLILSYDEFAQTLDVGGRCHLEEVFRNPDFRDWVYAMMKHNIRRQSEIVLLDRVVSRREGPDSIRLIEYEP